jgi:hypothetical protein
MREQRSIFQYEQAIPPSDKHRIPGQRQLAILTTDIFRMRAGLPVPGETMDAFDGIFDARHSPSSRF